MSTESVAVVVPLSSREGFTAEEQISLTHLRAHLGRYDKYLVAPPGLKIDCPDFEVRRLDAKYFGSIKAYSRLMLSPMFYESFRDYKFILTYHLDALVFSDELLDWCKKDFDFIGAPLKYHSTSTELGLIGNGGFALRKIEAFLRLFKSRRPCVDPKEFWQRISSGKPKSLQLLHYPRKIAKQIGFLNDIDREISLLMKGNGFWEDLFIAKRATYFDPEFRLAPLDMAVRFAFDEFPRKCFEMNGGRLPFGCHAWHKYDRDFWTPYLLKPAHHVSTGHSVRNGDRSVS